MIESQSCDVTHHWPNKHKKIVGNPTNNQLSPSYVTSDGVVLEEYIISPYRQEFFDGFVKNKLPGKQFFFNHKLVPLYITCLICTQGCHNISLIGWAVVIFCWFLSRPTPATRLARCKLVKKQNTHHPWRPPSPYGRHGAPPPALPHTTISQHDFSDKSMLLKVEDINVFTIY